MDLISLPIEFDKEKIDGSYRLVIAAVKRAKSLLQGTQPKIASKAKKVTTLAIEEVLSDSLHILMGEAAIKAKEEAKKLSHKRMIDEAKRKEGMPEDMTELEKDLKVYLTERDERDGKKTIEDIFGDGAT